MVSVSVAIHAQRHAGNGSTEDTENPVLTAIARKRAMAGIVQGKWFGVEEVSGDEPGDNRQRPQPGIPGVNGNADAGEGSDIVQLLANEGAAPLLMQPFDFRFLFIDAA